MLVWKKNILSELKERGYNTTRIRRENIISESTVQKLRTGRGVGWDNINTLCSLLECQPGDLFEFVPDPAPADPPQD